jgi:hypothetical protein
MTSRLLAFLGLGCLCLSAAPRVIPIPNGDFEQKQADWTISENVPMSSITDERAASGKYSLKIVDQDSKAGSSVTSARVPYKGIGELAIRGKAWSISGGGLGIYVRQYDAQGKSLVAEPHIGAIGGRQDKWTDFSRTFYTLPQCASLEVWFHSYSHAKVEAYIDDLEFVLLATEIKPPWKGSYKLTAKDKLTAADVLGPDGIVYPNWTRTGVDGGIPNVKAVASVADFGAKPDDGKDDSAAFATACEKVGSAGGGAILVGPGTYHLDMPVNIHHSGVVIRGSGRDRTNIVFRYDLPKSGLRFYGLAADHTVAPTDLIEAHALPTGLERLRLYAGDIQLRDWRRGRHSGNSFRVGVRMRDLFGKVKGDRTELRIEAEYADGPTRKLAVPVRLLRDVKRPAAPNPQAAFYFIGGYGGNRIKLAKDGVRGAVWLDLESAEGLSRGDKILIDGPATKRWKELTRNACLWGNYRRYAVRIVEVQGDRIRIEQPLRIEFPVIDGSYVQKLAPVEWCGVEDLTIEQTANLWINTVEYRIGWNCWARGVRVRMTGRFPIHTSMGKWCEVRDSVFEDAWFKGGGGTAYLGWQDSWDCLMENVECFDYRHAPLVQWAAAGNVIRNGVFHRSDAQWHSGWTNENLFENCVIHSVRGNGGYGFGMWASPPEDTAHGPNGPRNVIYNCDVTSEKTGLWMGGMNEDWLVLYNRFVVKKGQGIFAKTSSFDHIVRGNTFVVQDGTSPAVMFATPDCIGSELIDNTVYGKSIYAGAPDLEVERGNRLLPLSDNLPARPTPPVPSIYEWEKRNVPVKRELPIR